MNDFSGRTGAALVVGGSGGLGMPIARMLAKRGSHVAVTYRSDAEAGAQAVSPARDWGARASAYQLDLTSDEAAAQVVDAVVEEYGGLHTLVYAAMVGGATFDRCTIGTCGPAAYTSVCRPPYASATASTTCAAAWSGVTSSWYAARGRPSPGPSRPPGAGAASVR